MCRGASSLEWVLSNLTLYMFACKLWSIVLEWWKAWTLSSESARGDQRNHKIKIEESGIETMRSSTCNGLKIPPSSLKKRPRSVTQKSFKTGGPRCPVSALLPNVQKAWKHLSTVFSSTKEVTFKWCYRTIAKLMETIATISGLDIISKRLTKLRKSER